MRFPPGPVTLLGTFTYGDGAKVQVYLCDNDGSRWRCITTEALRMVWEKVEDAETT